MVPSRADFFSPLFNKSIFSHFYFSWWGSLFCPFSLTLMETWYYRHTRHTGMTLLAIWEYKRVCWKNFKIYLTIVCIVQFPYSSVICLIGITIHISQTIHHFYGGIKEGTFFFFLIRDGLRVLFSFWVLGIFLSHNSFLWPVNKSLVESDNDSSHLLTLQYMSVAILSASYELTHLFLHVKLIHFSLIYTRWSK